MNVDYDYSFRISSESDGVIGCGVSLTYCGEMNLLMTFRAFPNKARIYRIVEERGEDRFFHCSVPRKEVRSTLKELAEGACVDDFQTKLKAMRFMR